LGIKLGILSLNSGANRSTTAGVTWLESDYALQTGVQTETEA
jgi:hypothetical protein